MQATSDYAGNSVVLEIQPGVFAVYAHLQPNSLPFVFDGFTLQGMLTEQDLNTAATPPEPSPVAPAGPAGPQVASHPLYLTVIDFP